MDITWRDHVDALLETLRRHVGADPVECNSELRRQVVVRAGDVPAGTAAAWFACATSALAARKPFIILLEHVAVDSWTLTGTLGTSDGRVRAFHYDSDPSGGLGIWPRLSLAPCDDPRPRAQGTGLFGLKCANEDEDGKIQMADR